LQLADFLGQSANAVRWQVWMALLVFNAIPPASFGFLQKSRGLSGLSCP
jgi:hypothetical protein